ncbi:hypothetical protein HYX00_02715 [Candidatus Woesearchaeota archaeon]|nr:hypothetical protein [Candidatus Woesearchaeota archaeon]
MTQDLEKRLDDLSPEELQQLSELARTKSYGIEVARLTQQIETAHAQLMERVKGDIEGLKVYLNNLLTINFESKGPVPHSAPRRTSSRDEMERRKSSIRDLILSYLDANPDAQRANIPVDYFWKNIPKVRGEAITKRSYYATLRSIADEPNSRISYDKKTRTIRISIELTADKVEETALELLKTGPYASNYDVEQRLGAIGKGSIIAAYMRRIAKKFGLTTENRVTILPGITTTVHYLGEKPPITPLERVRAAIGDKSEVPYQEIQAATGLNARVITRLARRLQYVPQGKGQDRMYIRQTSSGA